MMWCKLWITLNYVRVKIFDVNMARTTQTRIFGKQRVQTFSTKKDWILFRIGDEKKEFTPVDLKDMTRSIWLDTHHLFSLFKSLTTQKITVHLFARVNLLFAKNYFFIKIWDTSWHFDMYLRRVRLCSFGLRIS